LFTGKENFKWLKEFGEQIAKDFSTPVTNTNGRGHEVILKLDTKQKINHVILQEDIQFGERTGKFVILGKKGKK